MKHSTLSSSPNSGNTNVMGIGICWGFWAIYIGFGCGIPKGYPLFKISLLALGYFIAKIETKEPDY
jgi:hypothetical protein